MILCDHCSKWTHYECAGLDNISVNRVSRYYCDQCLTLENMTITWKVPLPTRSQKEYKKRFYHTVESIKDHRSTEIDGKEHREFLIKWSGFIEKYNSWEPESHMDGCIQLLQTYLKQKNLAYSKMSGLVGADTIETNREVGNWVDLKDVLKIFREYQSRYFPHSNLKSCVYDYAFEEDEDYIYFIRYIDHCFVILRLAEKNIVYIADGLNLFRQDEDTAAFLRNQLSCRIGCCDYDYQKGVDYCGSSGILIALEFVRAHQSGNIPHKLIPPQTWRRKLSKRLHRFKSEYIDKVNMKAFVSCHICGKGYRSNNLRGLRQHQKYCIRK